MEIDDKDVVLDLVKQWFVDNDAALIGTTDEVVFWGNPEGLQDCEDWEITKVRDLNRFIKTASIPFHLMQSMSEDTIRASAQELERVYIRAAKVNGLAAPDCFNLNMKKAVKVEERIIMELLRYIQNSQENMLISSYHHVLHTCFETAELKTASTRYFNKVTRELIGFTNLIFAEKEKRLKLDYRLVTAIRHHKKRGAMELTSDDVTTIVHQTLVRAKALTH